MNYLVAATETVFTVDYLSLFGCELCLCLATVLISSCLYISLLINVIAIFIINPCLFVEQ